MFSSKDTGEMDRFDCIVWQDREVKFDIFNVYVLFETFTFSENYFI